MKSCVAAVALISLALLSISCQSAPGQPHLVIYLTDDLGLLDTTIYGAGGVRTPNLERLAAIDPVK